MLAQRLKRIKQLITQTFHEYDFAKDEFGNKLDLATIFENEDAKKFELFLKKNKIDNVFDITQTTIKAKNYVGVVKFKNYQFEVLPKLLAKDENDTNAILKNLFYMLSFTKELDIKETDIAKLSKSKNPFLEVLISKYANSLYDSLLRFIPKNYVLREDNLSFLKGKLKFNENIKLNLVNKAKFYCEYDEFCEDNLLNQLFYYITLMLSKVSGNESNKKRLKQILSVYSEISFTPITYEKVKNLKLPRNQMSFQTPFSLAMMFLEKSSVEISSRKFKTIAMLWDMNQLFEEFIYKFIRKNLAQLPEIKEVKYQNKEKLINRSENLLNSTENNRSFKNTYTDILIELNDGRLIILDTKYKINDGSRNDFGNADIYQLLAYKEIHTRSCYSNVYSVLAYPKTKQDFAWKHFVEEDKEILLTCFDMSMDIKTNPAFIINRVRDIINWTKAD